MLVGEAGKGPLRLYQNERERGTVGDEGKDAISGQITGNLVGYGGDFNIYRVTWVLKRDAIL